MSNLTQLLKKPSDETNIRNLIAPQVFLKDHVRREKYDKQQESKKSRKSRKSRKDKGVRKPKPPIVYKRFPKLNDLLVHLPLYKSKTHEIGDIVKFSNNAIVQIAEYRNRLVPIMFKLFPDDIEYFLSLNKHQRFQNAKWPELSDPKFQEKVQQLFVSFGFSPDKGAAKYDPQACATLPKEITLKYYQRIPPTYLVYGPYRGILVWHGLGSGKTCTSIDVIDKFIQVRQLSKGLSLENTKDVKFNIFVVLPPTKSLEENMRSELAKCPSLIREAILESKGRKNIKSDLTNRIINQNLTIISYVSLSNRIKNGKINLDNSLLIFDEAHQFLYPAKQFESKYAYLREQIRKIKDTKIVLLTATPVFRKMTDISKLLNTLRHENSVQLPETEVEFKKRYFINKTLNERAFIRDIAGEISYNTIEDNKSLFAKKMHLPKYSSYVTEDHYNRWLETHKNELKSYGISDEKMLQNLEGQDLGEDLVDVKDKTFLNTTSGYLKRSSAASNYPVRAYKPKRIWPQKFEVLVDVLSKYPREKHFIYSRHKESGSNAVGYYLEQNGWTRMGNNRYDHGTNPPATNNKVGQLLFQLSQRLGRKEISQETHNKERSKILRDNGPKKPYLGFTVLNSASSQKEIKFSRELYNDLDNVDGRYVRVFIGDEKFAEGVSLFNALHVHLLEPPYNYQTEEQAIARVVRMCGHKQIPPENRVVRIHKYYARSGEKVMTDQVLQRFNDENQNILEQIQKGAIKASLEHGLENVKINEEARKELFVLNSLSEAVQS